MSPATFVRAIHEITDLYYSILVQSHDPEYGDEQPYSSSSVSGGPGCIASTPSSPKRA